MYLQQLEETKELMRRAGVLNEETREDFAFKRALYMLILDELHEVASSESPTMSAAQFAKDEGWPGKITGFPNTLIDSSGRMVYEITVTRNGKITVHHRDGSSNNTTRENLQLIDLSKYQTFLSDKETNRLIQPWLMDNENKYPALSYEDRLYQLVIDFMKYHKVTDETLKKMVFPMLDKQITRVMKKVGLPTKMDDYNKNVPAEHQKGKSNRTDAWIHD